jgi:Tol biopolymer transport system component
VGTGRFVNLTANLPPLGAPGGILRRLGFSGDGADIWFTSGQRQMVIPLTGGTPRVFLGEGAASPAWSPDGTRLVYFVNGSGDPLFVADHRGADAKQIEAPRKLFENGLHNHSPVWSPDGQWIYFVHGLDPRSEVDLWRVRPSGESPEPVTERGVGVNFPAPVDGRTLLYTARAADGSGPWLWALDVPSKTARRLSQGLEQYTSLSASQDGRRVVATVSSSTANLWRLPINDGVVDDRDVQQYSVPMVRALAPRFGGNALFLLSAGGTGDGLWRVQDGQAVEVIRGSDAAISEAPAVSQDGQRVAVMIRKNGRQQLTVMAADGTGVRTVAARITVQGTAAWSPDSAWLAIGGSDAQGPGLFKIPVADGEPIRVATGDATNPVWSPDGNLIVYRGSLVGGSLPLIAVRPDGTRVDLPPDVRVRLGWDHRFLPNGKGLVYLNRNPRTDFWLLDLTTNATRQLTRLGNPGDLGWFDITPDGKGIVFDRSREKSHIVLIDLPK